MGEEPRKSFAQTGPGPHTGRCCGWSFENHADCAAPGYRWLGTLALRRSLHHQSPRLQAGGRWLRETL